jgi:Uma2 family endonuclease
VEEFRKLPEDSGPVYHEFRHGELVAVTRPKCKHSTIRRQIRRLLEPLLPPAGVVDSEFAFRPLPEHELWVADVAFVCMERERLIDPNDYLQGAPDIVVEILSPSNSAVEMNEREKLCPENGSKEFWVADADLRQVKVTTPDRHPITYRSGQESPLPLFGGAKVAVDAIFA